MFDAVFLVFWENDVPGKYLGVGFVDSVELIFLEMFDMYVVVRGICSQFLIIIWLINNAVIAEMVTDSGNRN